VHLRVGVPLSLYQSAYRILQEIFISHICFSVDDDHERRALTSYVLRISNLDMSLAISAYHHTEVSELEDSIRDFRHEHVHLIRKVSTDGLTGLPTREVLVKQIQSELTTLGQREGSIHLIMADLDFFKKVNDQYGHLTGDEVLKGVASRIRQSLRGTDMVGRYGGEEFIILLINKSEKQAVQIAERIRNHVVSSPIKANDTKINISLSQGLAMAVADDSVESLIERADQALYEAKASGRNCVVTARG
jgi:diguanylate cyclase